MKRKKSHLFGVMINSVLVVMIIIRCYTKKNLYVYIVIHRETVSLYQLFSVARHARCF